MASTVTMHHDDIYGGSHPALYGTFRLFHARDSTVAYHRYHLLHLQPIGVSTLLRIYKKPYRKASSSLACGHSRSASHHLWNHGRNCLLANTWWDGQFVYQPILVPFSHNKRRSWNGFDGIDSIAQHCQDCFLFGNHSYPRLGHSTHQPIRQDVGTILLITRTKTIEMGENDAHSLCLYHHYLID